MEGGGGLINHKSSANKSFHIESNCRLNEPMEGTVIREVVIPFPNPSLVALKGLIS